MRVCVLMLITAFVQPSVQDEVKIGQLSSCGHDLRGEVIAVNKRQIIIKGFHYDGKGPGAYFTAMKKPALKIQPSGEIGDKFVVIPYKEAGGDKECEVISYGMAISGKDIKLDLPEDISTYETIGVYCHQYCNNFGHVKVTGDFTVLAESPDGDWFQPSRCGPLSPHFKHPANQSLDCAKEKNLKNANLIICDATASGGGATQFYRSVFGVIIGMAITGAGGMYL
ncbi:unnamed protein product [Orchesella dallaii]|uniref:DM13 domain-containing protein n=1 Tax=Orchesella dallaii TaxID=48710 RepID=A0ABP1QHT8_9HEXA